MLGFFRRALSSWIVLALLALVLLAFMFTGIDWGGLRGGGDADAVGKVGRETVSADEVTTRVRSELDNARRGQPTLDMAAFLGGGALDQIVAQMLDTRAVELWARNHGVAASDRLIDGEIASIPAFAGPTGQFDPQAMRAILARQRIGEPQLRRDVSGDLVRRQILVPLAGGAALPPGIARPYASLLLERREGLIGVVPAASIPPGPPPGEVEITAEYGRNLAAYTLPERRTIRYALFGPETVAAQSQPGEAEIAAAYAAAAATYAPSEARTLQQVILPDQAAARAFVAKVRGGTAFAAAAQAAGFGPSDIAVAATSRDAFAKAAAPAVAAAAYAAAPEATIDPVRSELGWHVVHIVAIRPIAGRPLAAVRGEIAKALAAKKADALVAAMVDRIEDAIGNGATFAEAAQREKLAVAITPPLLAGGIAPDQPGYTLPVELAPLLKSAFDATPDDDPTVESLGATRRYALTALGAIVPAAPRPLAAVRATVAADIAARRAESRARAIAQAVVAKAAKGMPLATALAQSGLGLPPPQTVSVQRGDLARLERPMPPLQLLFALEAGKTQLLPLPGGQGFYIVQATRIARGDARGNAPLVDLVRGQLAQVVSEELLQQFATAAKREVTVTRNAAAIARLRATLTGAQPAGR